jgi:cell division protein FtsB
MVLVAGVLAEQVSQLQRDKQQLSEEIKAVRDSRAETEAHVQK